VTFNDWLDYQKLKLKGALGLLPPPLKGRHVHQCPRCGKFWMHEATEHENFNDRIREALALQAHTCPVPGCGGIQFWPVGSRQDGCERVTPSISAEDVERFKRK